MDECKMKSMSRRSKAAAAAASTTQFHGNCGAGGEASVHEGGHGHGHGEHHQMLQIKVDGGGREAPAAAAVDHLEALRYLSTAHRTSFHIPESGMIPQLRFNPGTELVGIIRCLAFQLLCISCTTHSVREPNTSVQSR